MLKCQHHSNLLLVVSEEVVREVFFESIAATPAGQSGTGPKPTNAAAGDSDSSGSGAAVAVEGVALGLGGYGSGSDSEDDGQNPADTAAGGRTFANSTDVDGGEIAPKAEPAAASIQQDINDKTVLQHQTQQDRVPELPLPDVPANHHQQQSKEEQQQQQHLKREFLEQQLQQQQPAALHTMDVDQKPAAVAPGGATAGSGAGDLLSDSGSIDSTFIKGQT